MSVETLAERLGGFTDRRTILRGVTGASLGAVAAALGVASTAQAASCASGLHPSTCCCLCHSRTDCQGFSGLQCCWSWRCCCGASSGCTNRRYMVCYECYRSTSYGCDAGCAGVVCSGRTSQDIAC